MSICVWGKIGVNTSADNVIVDKYEADGNGRQYVFKFDDTDDRIEVVLGYSSGASFQKAQGNTSRATLSTDWHHHCFVYNGTDIRIYLDGSLDTNTSNNLSCDGSQDNPCEHTDAIPDTDTTFIVGAGHGNMYYWDGLLDEIIIFDDALSAAEVLEIYTTGIDGDKGANDD